MARAERITQADGTTVDVTPAAIGERRDASPEELRRQMSGGLDDIVLRALRKDPRFRYPTARALGDDIRRYLDRQPVAASAGAWRYATGRFVARHRMALAGLALVTATAGITTTLLPARAGGRAVAGLDADCRAAPFGRCHDVPQPLRAAG